MTEAVQSRTLRVLHHWVTSPTALAGATTLALALPALTLLFMGVSPAAREEESTGYRYLYSLRTLYERTEALPLPQGQWPGIAQQVIQQLLTIGGLPILSLHPRVDIFVFFSIFLPFFYIPVLLRDLLIRIALATARPWYCAAIVVGLISTTPGFHETILKPDYHSWLAVAVIALCLLAHRCFQSEPYELRIRDHWYAMSVIAFALLIKPTYLLFVSTTLLAIIVSSNSYRAALHWFVYCSLWIVCALPMYLTGTWIYNQFSIEFTRQHLSYIGTFITATSNRGDVAANIDAFLSATPSFTKMVIPAILGIGLTLAIFRRIRLLAVVGCAALGTTVAMILLVNRFVGAAAIELNYHLVLLFGLLLVLDTVQVYRPNSTLMKSIYGKTPRWLLGRTCVAFAALILVGISVRSFANIHVPGYVSTAHAATEISTILRRTTGRILVLTPDNHWRSESDISILRKGASSLIADTSSLLVARMYPHVEFGVRGGVYTGNYEYIVFGRPRTISQTAAIQMLRDVYHVGYDRRSCDEEFITANSVTTLCKSMMRE